MRNFQEKKSGRRILESWPFLVVLTVVILVFAYGVFDLLNKMKDTKENKDIAEAKVNELENRKEKLGEDINNLNTDEGKERVFRENFGLARAGEGLIVIVDDKEKIADETVEKKGFFSFLKNLFK
ncbi:MAG: Septum formation initiator [Candidatus Nomurabacteria bacterium GW2011_GWA2_40_9]|uniref:Septum formation initiator n=1 Tax=Candidatus Nomurabacteria bacterium GW2011_GWA2_40_9 TaxID=1618734 RepID=A0A0G0WWK1_9BACT|nr:MAG: Septum formation initiator [Candidatus Nomurabacteria bacterium GW2011_GWA2_40_9]